MSTIRLYFNDFVDYAEANPDKKFLLTPIGTGYAGQRWEAIAEMVFRRNLPNNVVLSHSWITDGKWGNGYW